MAQPLRLEALTWTGVRDLIAEGPGMLLLPTGATEQHGPHLPINTDTVIATAICDYASARTGVPVLPAIPYTVSSGHTAKWPGTFSMGHATFIQMIRELTAWAVTSGWKKLLIINSHFGNDASLRVALDQLRVEYLGQLQIATLNTFFLNDSIKSYFLKDGDDIHANCAETDLMLHLAPETVKMDAVEDDPDRTADTVFSYPVAQTSLNGITGRASEGTAEQGAALFTEMGDALSEIIRTALTESPPLSTEHWDSIPKTPLT